MSRLLDYLRAENNRKLHLERAERLWNLAIDVKNLFDGDYSEYVGYWTDPFGITDNQYAGSDSIYCQATLKYDF